MDLGRYDTRGARARIASIARHTPLLESSWLTDVIGDSVSLKLECLQATGSFKLRGAANRILSLAPEERSAGVIATSSGNHGLATAYVAGREGIPATICVPDWIDPAKLAAIRRAGAQAVVEGATAEASEAVSLARQRETGATYVHPFDDPAVIAGQGTIGEEVLDDLPETATLVVPTSGGGLIAGIAVAVRRRRPDIRVVAACADSGRVLAESVRAGRLVQMPETETIATALAGNLGAVNRHSLALATALVDDWIIVTEAEILAAMRAIYQHHRLVVEGGGAVGVAAALTASQKVLRGPVVIVVSGGNIDLHRFAQIVQPEADATA